MSRSARKFQGTQDDWETVKVYVINRFRDWTYEWSIDSAVVVLHADRKTNPLVGLPSHLPSMQTIPRAKVNVFEHELAAVP